MRFYIYDATRQEVLSSSTTLIVAIETAQNYLTAVGTWADSPEDDHFPGHYVYIIGENHLLYAILNTEYPASWQHRDPGFELFDAGPVRLENRFYAEALAAIATYKQAVA